MGAWGVALGVVVGCGDGEPGVCATATDPAAGTGAASPPTDTSRAVAPTAARPSRCPKPDPTPTVEAMNTTQERRVLG